MKLHLPKKLLKALIIAASAVLPLTSAAETEVWVNFGGTTKGVADDTWNNILGDNAASLSGSYTLVDINGANAGNLVLSAKRDPYGCNSATLDVLKGYLDYQAQDKSTYWSLNFTMDDIAATNISVNLYNSGDSGNPIAPVIVNGKSYVGDTTSENISVNLEGTASWGNALQGGQQTTLNNANTVSVTGLGGVVSISPAEPTDYNGDGSINNSDGRFTLAGLSIVWDGSSSATSITLNSGVNDASSYLQGVEAANRVYSLSGNADGTSSFNIVAGEVVQGLQSAANTVTVTSDGAISVGQLFAKAGSTLNMNAAITSGADLNIGGFGRVNLNTSQTLNTLTTTVANLGIANGATVTVNGAASLNSAVHVAENSKLSLKGAFNDSFIMSATGNGTIEISKDTVLQGVELRGHTERTNATSSFAGTLSVKNGTLIVGDNSKWNGYWGIDLSSLKAIELDGGNMRLFGSRSDLSVINVKQNSQMDIWEATAVNGKGFAIEEINLEANLTSHATWDSNLSIGKLIGSGDITFTKAGVYNVTIGSIESCGKITNGVTMTIGTDASSKINISNTIVNNASLTVNGSISISENLQGFTMIEEGEIVGLTVNGTDGYQITNGSTYLLIDNNSQERVAITPTTANNGAIKLTQDEKTGDVTFVGGVFQDSIYRVNTQDVTVGGVNATDNTGIATGFIVATGRTVTIAGASDAATAEELLVNSTGEGNITVDCDFTCANGSISKATGILTIEEGHTLQLGGETDHVVSIASFNQVVLNGSTLKLHNNGTTIQNLTVKEASTLHFQDTSKTNNVPNAAHLIGITNLQAELDVTNGFKGRLVIDSLTGKGNLDIDLSNNPYVAGGDSLIVDIKEISNYSGIISYKPAVDTSVADAAAAYANNRITITSTDKGFSVGGLEVTGGVLDNRTASGAATIDIGGDTSLGAVKLGQGSSLTIFNRKAADAADGIHTVTMDSLAVDGSAMIQTQRDPNCYNGTINIGELTGTDATLTLKNGSKTTNATVYNLKGGTNQQTGTFSGVINLEGNAQGDSTRPVELLLSNAAVAEKAVINFQNSSADVSHSKYNQMYLKLGVDGAKVAGLRGETTTAAIIASASDTRTLHIVAAENANNTTNATISAGVNLMKSGAGKQTFSGDMSDFNGSLKVIEGELAFTAAEALKVNGLYVGPEKNAAATAASEGANVGILTVANGIAASGAVTLVGGAVINGNLDLRTATDVSFDVTTTPGTGITLNGALTMSSTEAFVTALGNSLAGLTAGEMLTVFTGVSSFTVGGVTYSAESENQLAGVDLSTWSSDVAVGQYTMTYDTSANVGSIVITVGEVIPEPASATLSLAALMMLCARRRRK